MVETGNVFTDNEELDNMLCHRGCQNDMEIGAQDDPGGVIVDRCNRKAYHEGGTWWLDRWLVEQ